GETADVYVPPGHSIVVRAPDRADGAESRKLILTGDDHDFDNTLYLAPYLQQQVNILYIGSDNPNDSKGMLYYVRRAFGPTGTLEPRVISHPGEATIAAADIETAHLIITADALNQENLVSFRRYLESGRTILLVMKSIDDTKTLAGLAGIENIKSEEADVDRLAAMRRSGYAMLGRIEFKHPLLVPFSEPRFGDFTQIHFWKYRRINIEELPSRSDEATSAESALPDVRVLARFDSGDPAWFELPVGQGSLLVMTCGWHPSDSQLALSSKFIPLLYSILEYGGALAGQQSQYFVGDHIPIPHSIKAGGSLKAEGFGDSRRSHPQAALEAAIPGSRAVNLQVRKPNDSLISLDAGQQAFTQTDLPGIYAIESSTGNHLFAVNLPAKECQTAPMPIEELERFTVSLTPPLRGAGRAGQIRRYDNFAGLEYEQKVWRWVFIALLAVSLIELWLAGWLNRPPSNLQGEQK
ncbi:MAG: hypothetical protein WAV28_15000, partial [Sedimentisphaerales bacterium]